MDLVFEHTHGQTDERTDGQTDVEVETALLSKDKNVHLAKLTYNSQENKRSPIF